MGGTEDFPGAPGAGWQDDEDALVNCLRQSVIPHDAPPLLDGFRELEEIGRGAQAVVYRAVRNGDGHRVAIKVLLLPTFPSSPSSRRFLRELDLVRRLDHPGIVRLLDSGRTADGRPFLAMELLEGPSLEECLPLGQAGGPLPDLKTGLRLFLQVCLAISHAHRHGVIHRDLKPGNILLDEVGRPRVVDFGLARSAAPVGTDGSLSRGGYFLGNLAHAAPEQLDLDPDQVDSRCDIYALGVVLYQMLTGELPVDVSGGFLATMRRIHTEPLEAPRRVLRRLRRAGRPGADRLPRLPRDLDTVVRTALARNRDERYQSADELAADIERVLSGEPVTARRERSLSLLFRLARRHRLIAGALVVSFLTTAAAGLIIQRQAQEKESLYRWALETNERILGETLRGLTRLAGGWRYREDVARQAVASFEQVLFTFPGDQELLHRHARALVQLGMILRDRGAVAEAAAAYEQALVIQRELASRAGARADWRGDLSINLVKLGDLRKEANDRDGAQRYYEEAWRLDEKLATRSPREPRLCENLFWSYVRLGDLALQRGDQALAKRWFDLLAPQAQKLLEMEPERIESHVPVYAVSSTWTEYWLHEGDFEQAIASQERACKVAGWILESQPNDQDNLARLGWAHRLLAAICLQAGHYERAAAESSTAIELSERVVAAEPQNLEYRCLHLSVWTEHAQLRCDRGEVEGGIEAAERAAAIGTALWRDGGVDRWDSALGLLDSRLRLAQCLTTVGEVELGRSLLVDGLHLLAGTRILDQEAVRIAAVQARLEEAWTSGG